MLNDMYNYLADNSSVKIFIKYNCRHLLLPPKGNTPYSKYYFQFDKFISHSNLVTLPLSYSYSIT